MLWSRSRRHLSRCKTLLELVHFRFLHRGQTKGRLKPPFFYVLSWTHQCRLRSKPAYKPHKPQGESNTKCYISNIKIYKEPPNIFFFEPKLMEGSIFLGGFIFKGGGWAWRVFCVVADCFSRTQTDEGWVFSEGKVSRPEGRGTDRRRTPTLIRCGGVSPHKPRKKPSGDGFPTAFILGLRVKGKRAVKRTEGSHANDRPSALTQTT